MKYMKAFIRIEIWVAVLWMSAIPCMAQQNLRSKRAVSKSTVLPSIGRLSDKLSIMEDVKTRFAYTESSDINIAFDELGVSNTYLKGYVFHLDELTSGYESDMGERSPYESKCYDVVEEMPSFPGGQGALMYFISSNLAYPATARESMIQGRVIVGFVVERDGSISNVKVSRSVDPALDKEAMRVVKSMPKWKPGKQNSSAVRVKYTVPVIFRLE